MSEHDGFHSISELGDLYRRGVTSPLAEAQRMLARIRELNPLINAFSQVDEARTLGDAKQSTERWAAGRPKGPLDGIPFSVKDTLMAKGYATRRGSPITSEAPATEDAPIVERVLESGAVILGITTTPEFGGGAVTISPLTGITRNAWDRERTSGGSSGGAASSIAAGIGVFALATDAGGSIRTPAALNGVVGFKATGGVIPTYPANVAGGLSSPGPIARSVEDCRIVFETVAHTDVRDCETVPLPAGGHDHPVELRTLKLAATLELGSSVQVSDEVKTAFQAACEALVRQGVAIEQARPELGGVIDTYKVLLMSGFAYSLRNLPERDRARIGEQLQDILRAGAKVSLADYLTAQQQRRDLGVAMQKFHQTFDYLLTPTVACTAFPADRIQPEEFERYQEPRAWVPFAYPFNLTQQPAISIPCGFTPEGLPVGLQIVGPRFSDRQLLDVAAALAGMGLAPERRPRFTGAA